MIQSNRMDKIKSNPSLYCIPLNVLFHVEIGLCYITKAKSIANYVLCNISTRKDLPHASLLCSRL